MSSFGWSSPVSTVECSWCFYLTSLAEMFLILSVLCCFCLCAGHKVMLKLEWMIVTFLLHNSLGFLVCFSDLSDTANFAWIWLSMNSIMQRMVSWIARVSYVIFWSYANIWYLEYTSFLWIFYFLSHFFFLNYTCCVMILLPKRQSN